jgi:urease accessory protein
MTQLHWHVGPQALLDLLQITDRAFPTGAFVHSQGLEWLVKHSDQTLEELLTLRLDQQLARFELVFLVHAYGEGPHHLDERFHSMVLPRESREASVQVGRQLARNAAELFPAARAASGLPHGHAPLVFGMVCAAIEVPSHTAAAAYAFQALRGQVSAAQRLTRLGQVEAQRLLHRLKPAIREAVESAHQLPIEDAAPFAPILEVAAMAHERSAVRLFVS